MRIAQIATVDTPVRRDHSGSIEQHVWLLARELTAMGHEVTTFGAAGGEVAGSFVATLPGTYGENGAPEDWRICEVLNIGLALERAEEFDVIHSHGYLLGLPFDPLVPTPMAHTLHIHPYDDSLRLRAMYPRACITAISRFQWDEAPEPPPAAIIPHGVDEAQFTFRAEPEDYVCYLGRFIPDKGALTAIRTARTLGLRLVLAGQRNDYFDEVIAREVDGRGVEYIGAVAGAERDRLLGAARALLYPIEAPEPFGLVQVEAMMCGTPVVAMRLGAVPEIVDENVTGCTADDAAEFAAQIPRALTLDRTRIHETARRRFSAATMAREYERLYANLAPAQHPIRRSTEHFPPTHP